MTATLDITGLPREEVELLERLVQRLRHTASAVSSNAPSDDTPTGPQYVSSLRTFPGTVIGTLRRAKIYDDAGR
jgi:hypothetical protein